MKEARRILVVDDDPGIGQMLCEGARASRLPGRRHHVGRRGAREVRGQGLRRRARRPRDARPRRRRPVRDAAAPLPGLPIGLLTGYMHSPLIPAVEKSRDGRLQEAGADPGSRRVPAARNRALIACFRCSRRRRRWQPLGLVPGAPVALRERLDAERDRARRPRAPAGARGSCARGGSRARASPPPRRLRAAAVQSSAARSYSPARLARAREPQERRRRAPRRSRPRARAGTRPRSARRAAPRSSTRARLKMSRASSAWPSSTHWQASAASAASETMSCRLCSNTRASIARRRAGARSRSRRAGSPRRRCRRGA